MTDLTLSGDNTTHPGVSLLGDSSVALTLDDTGTLGFGLAYLDLSDTKSLSIASTGASGGDDVLAQVDETANDLPTVTITGSELLYLGHQTGEANSGDGVVTDSDATATKPTTIQSSLKLINASATTGGVHIFAGATNTSSAGSFDDGGSLNADVTITYTGLKIEGGSGNDIIENDAKDGVVTDGNGTDLVVLGGADASATLGKGINDQVFVGLSELGTTETPGSALGDTVKFGAASSATLSVFEGAEAGSTAGTTNIGLTKVQDAANDFEINFAEVTGSSTIKDETTNVASATNLTEAENLAVGYLGGPGVAYFVYKGNEYFIATNNTETEVSSNDAIVELVDVTDLTASNSDGVVTLLSDPGSMPKVTNGVGTANIALLGNYIASFATGRDLAGSTPLIASPLNEQPLLVHPHTG
jgi:hypothetical protein